jgi:hypothetical protein
VELYFHSLNTPSWRRAQSTGTTLFNFTLLGFVIQHFSGALWRDFLRTFKSRSFGREDGSGMDLRNLSYHNTTRRHDPKDLDLSLQRRVKASNLASLDNAHCLDVCDSSKAGAISPKSDTRNRVPILWVSSSLQVFQTRYSMYFSSLPACYMTRPSHIP